MKTKEKVKESSEEEGGKRKRKKGEEKEEGTGKAYHKESFREMKRKEMITTILFTKCNF